MMPAVLLIEDDAATRFGFVRYFSKEGYDIIEAASRAEAVDAMALRRYDALVLDINLPDGNGIELIDTIRLNDPCVPIIVITGSADIPLAVEAMQRGADNFLTKPVNNTALAAYLAKTLEIGVLKRRLSAQKRLTRQEDMFFGSSAAMEEIGYLARTAASADSPVLITGETGTGKGMLADWIHRHSLREAHQFVEINCSGLRGEMLSRELFGHVRGAFTSADQDRKGLLDISDRGTLFLDEIGDMGIEVQAQFLKVLEDKTYRRLGDVKRFRSDFRLICATHRELGSLVQNGNFRQDLLYRINLIVIHLPPLRHRLDELPAICAYLLRSLGSSEAVITGEVMELIKAYSWPGNIRELKNVLERALLLTPRGATLRQAHFAGLGSYQPPPSARPRTIQEVEQTHIRTVLAQVDGDMNRAAKSLNISRATLYRRLKQLKDA